MGNLPLKADIYKDLVRLLENDADLSAQITNSFKTITETLINGNLIAYKNCGGTCTGTCYSTCTGKCVSCTNGCVSTCSSTCVDSCMGGCKTGCMSCGGCSSQSCSGR